MKSLLVKTRSSYEIVFSPQLLAQNILVEFCKNKASQFVIVSDDTVSELYGEPLQQLLRKTERPVHLLHFPPGEHYKTRETKAWLEDEMLALHCTRDTCIIALGGGIVTDLTGFLAATYCRGVPVIYIPTTLLAMVDASIGGKTGVNTSLGKNLIGTFSEPISVYIDVNFLETLPALEFNNGVSEIIKHAVIADKNLFTQISSKKITLEDKEYLQQIIYRSCEIKREVVEQDFEEKNRRQLLNFGHTIGHAIEAASDYQIRHGEAVAIGMIGECYLSTKLGGLDSGAITQLRQVLQDYQLPTHLPPSINLDDLMGYFKLDKKSREQQVYSVLLSDLGHPDVRGGLFAHPIEKPLLLETLHYLLEEY